MEPTMKRRLASLTLPLLLVAAPCAAEVIDVDSAQLEKLLTEGVPVVDVRSQREHKRTGIIEGSHLLTFYDQAGGYDMDKWVGDLGAIAGPEDPVILVCGTGKLTVGIAEYLDKRAGYARVYNLGNGIKRWIADGHPTVPPKSATGESGPP
jgi:rhodanese-related sulfurtransferase